MDWLPAATVLLAQNDGGGGAGTLSLLLPFVVIGLLFYFMLIRPQRRQEHHRRQMIEGLKKNDHVVTIGGIIGTVTSLNPKADEVTIRVDETSGAKLRVTRASIARVITEPEGANSAGE